ncbi:hypothetical protein ACNKHO_03310 [Shigella flexneri]
METALSRNHRSWRAINDTGLAPSPYRAGAIWVTGRRRNAGALALADARYGFSYRQMRQQVVALANLLVSTA